MGGERAWWVSGWEWGHGGKLCRGGGMWEWSVSGCGKRDEWVLVWGWWVSV